MDFLTWKQMILDSVEEHGFNKTYRRFKLSSRSLRIIISGDEYAGLQSWKRLGAHSQAPKGVKDGKSI